MATSDSHPEFGVYVPDVTLAVARQTSGGGGGAGSGISVSYTGTGIGETVTISTSTLSFTEKTNAKPLYYVDPGAEGLITQSPLSRRPFSLDGRPLGNLDTTTKFGVQASAAVILLGSAPDYRVTSGTIGPIIQNVPTDVDGAGDHLRVISRWRRNFDGLDAEAKEVEFNGTAWNIKRYRWHADAVSGIEGTNNFYFPGMGQRNNTHGAPRFTPENTAGADYPESGSFDLDLFGMAKNKWVTDFVRVRQSSAAGVADAEIEYIANGMRYFLQGFSTQNSGQTKYREFSVEQFQFLYTDVEWREWRDFIYIDDTAHALIVTDKPSWSDLNATMDPLIPEAWSPAEITAKTRCDISGRYLYVIDGAGTVLNNEGVAI